MEELKFVMKCLFFTALVTIFMQVKIGSQSIENHTYRWLQSSKVSQYLQSTAAGGAMALRSFGLSLKDGIASSVDSFQDGAQQKAVR